MNWNQIHNREVIKENPVMGINIVELLERKSAYQNQSQNYFNRIKKSLTYIPEEYKDAALAIFSSVVYIPDEFIKATYHFFGNNFKEKYNIHTSREIGESSHIFEIDPSGLKNKFFQMNGINQRLHPDYYARINDITEIARMLLDLFHTDEEIIQTAYHDILKIGKKSHWIILTDKALSGQSLLKDLERYLLFRSITHQVIGNRPVINVKAQITTNDAIKAFNKQFADTPEIHLDYSLLFTDDMKINSPNCSLFKSNQIHEKALDLCRWLAEIVILPDDRFNTMRGKSGDDLKYGYKACGLTLVDFSNCPTNSVPILWYDNTETDLKIKYKGPFPRVQSRLGIQEEQPVGNAWTKIEKRKDEIVEILNRRIHA